MKRFNMTTAQRNLERQGTADNGINTNTMKWICYNMGYLQMETNLRRQRMDNSIWMRLAARTPLAPHFKVRLSWRLASFCERRVGERFFWDNARWFFCCNELGRSWQVLVVLCRFLGLRQSANFVVGESGKLQMSMPKTCPKSSRMKTQIHEQSVFFSWSASGGLLGASRL